MIDTIVLTFPINWFSIWDYGKFSPYTNSKLFSEEISHLKHRQNKKWIQNPTKQELRSRIYKPRITLIAVMGLFGPIIKLRIELSLPKLLYKNNFDELTDADYPKIFQLLKDTLDNMGIRLFDHHLDNAPVTAIHYSKNIPLPYHTTPPMIITELHKLNPFPRLTENKVIFRNGGQSFQLHANSYEIVIYDKIKDLEQAQTSDKRAIENDNSIQLNLLDEINQPKFRNILRLEIRLNKTAKIKSILKENSIDQILTFKQLFKQSTSQKVLQYFWQELTKNKEMLLLSGKSPIETMEIIKTNNPSLKARQILELSGAITAINSSSHNQLRNIIDTARNHSYWYKLKRKLSNLNIPKNGKYNLLIDVEKQLQEFTPTKLSNLREQQFKYYTIHKYYSS